MNFRQEREHLRWVTGIRGRTHFVLDKKITLAYSSDWVILSTPSPPARRSRFLFTASRIPKPFIIRTYGPTPRFAAFWP